MLNFEVKERSGGEEIYNKSELKKNKTWQEKVERVTTVEVCKICNNNSQYELEDNSSCKKREIKKIIPTYNNKSLEESIKYFDIPGEQNRIIYPCNCLIPIHIKCLFRLILTSQNLQCANCNSFIIFKKKNSSCLKNSFRKNIIINHLIHIIIIFANIILSVYSFIWNFSPQHEHFRYILGIGFILLCIISIFYYIKFVYSVISVYIPDQLEIEERNLSERGVVELAVTKNKDTSNKNLLNRVGSKRGIESAQRFYSFMEINFGLLKSDVIEYRSQKFQRGVIHSINKKKIMHLLKEITSATINRPDNKKLNLDDFLKDDVTSIHNNIIVAEENKEQGKILNQLENKLNFKGSPCSEEINKNKKENRTRNDKNTINSEVPLNSPAIAKSGNDSGNIIHYNNYNNIITNIHINTNSNILNSGTTTNVVNPNIGGVNTMNVNSINNDVTTGSKFPAEYSRDNKTVPTPNNLIEGSKSKLRRNSTSKKEEIHIKYNQDIKKIEEIDSIQYASEEEISHHFKKSTKNNLKIPYYSNNIRSSKGFTSFFKKPTNSIPNTPNESVEIPAFEEESANVEAKQKKIIIWEEEKDLSNNLINLQNNMDCMSPISNENSYITTYSNLKILENVQMPFSKKNDKISPTPSQPHSNKVSTANITENSNQNQMKTFCRKKSVYNKDEFVSNFDNKLQKESKNYKRSVSSGKKEDYKSKTSMKNNKTVDKSTNNPGAKHITITSMVINKEGNNTLVVPFKSENETDKLILADNKSSSARISNSKGMESGEAV